MPLISLAALASFPQGKLSLQYVTEGLRSRRGEASFVTFSKEKVPAGRMKVFYLPSSVSLRSSASPWRSLKQHALRVDEGYLTFPLGEGARRADEGLLLTLISLAALASFSQEKL